MVVKTKKQEEETKEKEDKGGRKKGSPWRESRKGRSKEMKSTRGNAERSDPDKKKCLGGEKKCRGTEPKRWIKGRVTLRGEGRKVGGGLYKHWRNGRRRGRKRLRRKKRGIRPPQETNP